MERTYDVFEKLPDGSLMWREAIKGHENAVRRLQELSAKTPNELQLIHVETKTVIATTKTRRGLEV
jgi:hypothetical protein